MVVALIGMVVALFMVIGGCVPPQDLREEVNYANIRGYVYQNGYPQKPASITAFYYDEKAGRTIAVSSPISSYGEFSLELPEGKEYYFVVSAEDGTPLNATYGSSFIVAGDGEIDFTMNLDRNLSVSIRTPGSIFQNVRADVKDGNGNVLPDNVETGNVYVNVPAQSIDTNGDGVADMIIPEHTAPANFDFDRNGNGKLDFAEDLDGNGIAEGLEDHNGNGTPDIFEDINGNGIPDYYDNAKGVYLVRVPEQHVDTNGDGTPDLTIPEHYAPANLSLDSNGNGKLDIVEDIDGDGVIEVLEDNDGNGVADIREDKNKNGVPDYYETQNLPVNDGYAVTTNPPQDGEGSVAITIIKTPIVYKTQVHYLLAYSCGDCHKPNGYADTIVGGNAFHIYISNDINWNNPTFLESDMQQTYNEIFNPPTPPFTQGYTAFGVKGDPDNSLLLLKASGDIEHNAMTVWEKTYRAYEIVYNWFRQGAYYDYYTFRNNAWTPIVNNCYSCHFQKKTCTTDPDTGGETCTESYGSAVLQGSRFKVYDGYETCTTDWDGTTTCVDDDQQLTYDSIVNNGLVDTSNTYEGADTSPLLVKARGESNHGGGFVLDPNSAEYKALRVWIWHGSRF